VGPAGVSTANLSLPQAPSSLLRGTARVLSVSAVSAASTPLAPASSTLPRSRLLTWSARARARPSQSRRRHPRPPTYRRPNRSRNPSASRSSRTRRRRSSRRGTGTRPTRCSRTPLSSRRSAARASPSSSATVRRAGLRARRARSSARRGCVGLYGFDVRGAAAFPKNVLEILRNTVGAEVLVTSVPPCVSRSPSASPALMTCPQDGANRRARAGPRTLGARIQSRREPDGALDGRARLQVPDLQGPARGVHPALAHDQHFVLRGLGDMSPELSGSSEAAFWDRKLFLGCGQPFFQS
jgi:hypothetical protein